MQRRIVFSLGAVGSVAVGLFFGLLGSLIYLRKVGSLLKATAVNVFAAVILVCCAGTWFLLPIGFLLWVAAIIWVSVHEIEVVQRLAMGVGDRA